ncbi:MAG: DUF4382 domain-containing protein [Nitrospirae bacterium]|nr:DUF4382 domain-containing protein [Nitrospirota bacterium]
MRKIVLLITIGLIAASVPFLMLSCSGGGGSIGGGGGGSSSGSSNGSVALFITDSPDEDFKQVTLTINKVQLVHMGSGASCDVLTAPVTADITDLSTVLQLVDVEPCPARSYNRIEIELDEQVVLTDLGDTTADCNLASYKDDDNKPNVLQCNGNTCSINISGAVNVLSKQNHNLALDFDLKEFEVSDFNQPFCTVTMKVSPLNASDFDQRHDDGCKEGIVGLISDLDNVLKSFTLTTEGGTFTVTYDGVTSENIDSLLDLALTDQLKVKVEAAAIDLNALTIEASSILIKVDGAVSDLDTAAKTFTLTYQTGKSVTVDYLTANVEGTLSNSSSVEVKLNAFDGVKYLATEVEVD